MRLIRPVLALFVVVLGAGACKHSPTDTGSKVTITKFTCDSPGGGTVGCDITIPSNATKLQVTFQSHDCLAHGDVITISEPTSVTLTTDACYETVPKTIEIPGPFSVTHLAMKVTSDFIKNQPELKVTGTASPWTIQFEDGGDQDFNDAVITITAL